MNTTTQPDLFPESMLVSNDDGRLYTTSLLVAEHFHKNHQHVLRNIEKLLIDLQSDCPKLDSQIEFSRRNFAPSEYINERGKTYPMFKLSHDGFALLAMGFTGKEALAWKIDFLNAFREMERQLAAAQKRQADALFALRPRWQPILQHPHMPRQQLISLTGHKSAGSITACRHRMRQVGLLEEVAK